MMPETIAQPIIPSACDFKSVLDACDETPLMVEAGHLSVIEVTGEESENFLQNQFSNDLRTLESDASQLHAYCNPKGRAFAVIRVLSRPAGGFRMLVPASIAQGLEKRLKMFVLRSRVVLSLEESIGVCALIGGRSGLNKYANLSMHTCQGNIARAFLVGDRNEIAACQEHNRPVYDRSFWKLSEILSGIPQIYPETTETFIPQHMNLDLVDGVSFQKGCYPGQEIIARLKYLGKSKQRLHAATVQYAGEIHPGTDLFNPDHPGQRPGKVVDAVRTSPDTFHLSAVLPVSAAEPSRMCLGSAEGPVLVQLPLPYPLPDI